METERFTWDETKRLSNLRKHGLDFADAAKVFAGIYVSHNDERYLYEEIRSVAIGLLEGRPVTLTYAEKKDETRIVSFRKANRNEQKTLSKHLAYGLGENR